MWTCQLSQHADPPLQKLFVKTWENWENLQLNFVITVFTFFIFTGPRVNPWTTIRRRLSKGTIKFVPSEDGTSDTDSKDIELKESFLKSDSLPRKLESNVTTIERGSPTSDSMNSNSIEVEALNFNFNRRRATSCVEIYPRMVENLCKESKSQEKADSLDNFLSKLTSRKQYETPATYINGKQPSMTSLQSFAKPTVSPRIQDISQDIRPKKTEKFAQVWNKTIPYIQIEI